MGHDDLDWPHDHYLSGIVRVLAHDLNNALAAVRILAEMNAEGPLAEDMNDILEASDLATGLLDAMRALAIHEGPPADGEPPASVAAAVRKVSGRPALRTLVGFSGDDTLKVTLGSTALRRILLDVLLGARLLSPQGGIRVRTTSEGDWAVLDVVHGLSRLRAAQLEGFDDPRRVRELRARGVTVMPSALAVARALVDAAGGSIAFRDDDADGLVLTIRLPRAHGHGED